jgi:hypothetical protein
MKQISLMEVKQALRDSRFRDSLPQEFKDDVQKFLHNPGCACNLPIYRRILREAKDHLMAYYPGRELLNVEEEISNLAKNNFSVINCSKDELEEKLRRLGPGRKQIAVARYEDQVTVVVNELDLIY